MHLGCGARFAQQFSLLGTKTLSVRNAQHAWMRFAQRIDSTEVAAPAATNFSATCMVPVGCQFP
jgi:hypothetical protein